MTCTTEGVQRKKIASTMKNLIMSCCKHRKDYNFSAECTVMRLDGSKVMTSDKSNMAVFGFIYSSILSFHTRQYS